MPSKRNKDQDHFVKRFQSIYQQDYTKWLVFGRKRGFSNEVITDAIQEMSLKVLDISEKLSDFSEKDLHAYIMTIFKNTLYDNAKGEMKVSLDEDMICDDDSPEEMVMNQIEYEKLSEKVKQLNAQQQHYIYLKFYLCLSSKEIGE